MRVVIGIDLGTSQSAGCYPVGGGRYRMVENELVRAGLASRENHEKYHPSYVNYTSGGEPVVAGVRAKMLADMSPRTTVYDSKRLIGRPHDDPEVQKYRKLLAERGHYELSGERDDAAIRIGTRRVLPEEACAEIVCAILKDAFEQEPSIEVSKIVISVPAYYDNVQKARTRQAALLAIRKLKQTSFRQRVLIDPEAVSLDNDTYLSLIPEPSAAFITYAEKRGLGDLEPGGLVMVFDMGAGTLDITIGTLGAGQTFRDPLTRKERYTLDIVGIHGNKALGGRDIDQLIISHVKAVLSARGLRVDNRLTGQIREQAEKAKIELSSSPRTSLFFPDQGISLPMEREQLEKLVEPVLSLCRREIRVSMSQSGVIPGDLSAVVLVGGPTMMPCVRRMVEEETGTGISEIPGWDPMLCVAEGAARLEGTIVNEQIPFDYHVAVEMFDGVFLGTKVASAGDPANLERQLALPVPCARLGDIHEVQVYIAESDGDRGPGGYRKCIQKIRLPVTSAYGHARDIRKVDYQWKPDLRPHLRDDIDFRYCSIDMQFRITPEGLIADPRFFDPATGVQIRYPSLPVRNYGRIDILSMEEYDQRWEEFAMRYLKELESQVDAVIRYIGEVEHCGRKEAVERYFRIERVPDAGDQLAGLKKDASEMIERLEASGSPDACGLVRQLEAAITQAAFDSTQHRYRLQMAIAAARTAVEIGRMPARKP